MLIPSATYRLQFSKDFTFRQAVGMAGYLSDLGISTVYASPILQAFPGSNHGYDVTDFNRINPELGTLADLEALVTELQQKGISWIQDLVPNHMHFSPHNQRLWEVLEKGQGSPYASYFDIDWNHPLFGGRLLVPLLASGLQEAIDAGRFQLGLANKGAAPGGRHESSSGCPRGFVLNYGDLPFPLNAASNRFLTTLYFDYDPWLEPERTPLRLASLSHDLSLIQTLLSRQHYLPAPYSRTDREINYRRFF
jgi:(1->4)-alpha-D-glucan 1-alpha-D-glucosylmutase